MPAAACKVKAHGCSWGCGYDRAQAKDTLINHREHRNSLPLSQICMKVKQNHGKNPLLLHSRCSFLHFEGPKHCLNHLEPVNIVISSKLMNASRTDRPTDEPTDESTDRQGILYRSDNIH